MNMLPDDCSNWIFMLHKLYPIQSLKPLGGAGIGLYYRDKKQITIDLNLKAQFSLIHTKKSD